MNNSVSWQLARMLKYKRSKIPKNVFSIFEQPIRSEIFSVAQLEQHGESLAAAQKVSADPTRGKKLHKRVTENGLVLLASYHAIAETVRDQRAITPAAEWLIDNFHIIEEQLRDIREHLPPEFYKELPKLAEGPLVGYPRVYGIAWAFIAHTDSLFDLDLLKKFVRSYQKVQPLTIGELWALSITLRVVMVENLRRLGAQIVGSQMARKDADRIADELLGLAGQPARSADEIRNGITEEPLRGAFAVQLVQRLRFQDPKVAPVLQWLDERLAKQGLVADEIVPIEHNSQTAANVTVRNIITSMRLMSALDWQDFFEDVSLVDEVLAGHPLYRSMDFTTRDRYRHGLEELARGAHHTELDVAYAVIAKCREVGARLKAENPADGLVHEKWADPGYYLISTGRAEFEKELSFKVGLRRHFLRWYVNHAPYCYIFEIALVTALILAVPLMKSARNGTPLWALGLLGFLGIFAASDIALALVHRATIALLGPRHLPRLKLAEGIPSHLKTFIVVPTLLISEAEIDSLVEQLEVHYLSNPEGDVHFALLTDWLDSLSENRENDLPLLDYATKKVVQLNSKYGVNPKGEDLFYIYHRRRLWNESEKKWIGWERKRGKLHEFNRLLRGAQDTSYVATGGRALQVPSGVKYVITLDSDTKLPKSAVSKLVGTFAHPLNFARYDEKIGRVVEGYGILQPRITASLPAMHDSTIYQRLFSGPAGTDPYASAVSDVYQDLFSEGSFTGKGIYDVDVFEKALAGRIPENSLLSHDLFEGNYSRCALLSDVEFFEDFPSHSEVAASRVHRWIRGDWQLLPWILGRGGRSISLVGRWKMFDNLRRSFGTAMLFFTLIACWCVPQAATAGWVGLVMLSFALPALIPFVLGFVPRRRKVSIRRYLVALSHDLVLGCGRFLVSLTLLAHHAWLSLDAIGRALFRLFISHHKLLEWMTAAQAKQTSSLSLKSFVKRMSGGVVYTLISTALIYYFNKPALTLSFSFLVLWFLSPYLAQQFSMPPRTSKIKPLLAEDITLLRLTARQIWRFFTDFVTAEDHYLPPDNFQEDPKPVIAHRSSPTNFGLYLLSTISARDFGWIGAQEMTDRLSLTLDSMARLPRHNGHFFNWYETTQARALDPKYISSVDNGNLAGHLLAVVQSCEEIRRAPLFTASSFGGLLDSVHLLKRAISNLPDDKRNLTLDVAQLEGAASQVEEVLGSTFEWDDLEAKVETLVDIAETFANERGDGDNSEILYWVGAVQRDIKSRVRDFNLFVPWAAFASKIPFTDSTPELKKLWQNVSAQLTVDVPLDEIPSHCSLLITELVEIKKRHKLTHATPPEFIDALLEYLENSIHASLVLDQKLVEISKVATQLFREMDFRLLYDLKRKLFSIGYRVADNALDASYYDLLASEARLTSFVAIAKGDVAASHWFRLGRRLTPVGRGAALISWSGSMFEYLMPSLVMYTPAGSLLEQTCRLIVSRQIDYGTERSVPWGVSESAYNTRDLHLTYQYSNFGVPDLGLKRGLGQDLVIAPYATVLAALYDAPSAVTNLRRLVDHGAQGQYGFYEAVDFTASRLPEGEKAAVVRTYMAHHQGMSLVSIANVLLSGAMRRRFHGSPMVQAAELLLQERTPRNVSAIKSHTDQPQVDRVNEGILPVSRRYHSPNHPVPTTHLLANGRYTVMLTSAGSGYSRFGDVALTRWREDVTRDQWGTYFFLRDTESGDVWSATYQPTAVEAERYEAVFSEDRVRITREDNGISSDLEIFVSPEDGAEIRRLTLTNTGSEAREIEITSYAEVVLATPAADTAHPAFSNLFVQTEYQPDITALIVGRRPRSQNDKPVFMAHVIATDNNALGGIEYETDRSRFIGRGRSVKNPVSIYDGKPLSNTVGNVLDPIVSLRTRVHLEPSTTTHVTFTTLVAPTRDDVIHLADKYRDASTFDRASTLAWTQAQVQLHYLGIDHDEAHLFQRLANRVLYFDPSLRPSSDILKRNQMNVTGLWAHGISGDYPIVLVRIDDIEDRGIIRQLLRAHEYWGTKHLIVDLIILNDKVSSYVQDLQIALEAMARTGEVTSGSYLPASKGKVYTLRADLLSQQDLDLIQTAARATLVSRHGSLAEQVKRMRKKSEKRSELRESPATSATETTSLPMPQLQFFNGLGGFSADGREYVTYLAKGQRTPAPWINVIANADFGFHVSETGSGYTWSSNSRENQITPWFNDPVCDPSGEAFYIRDKQSGALWSPTAAPIRVEGSTYIARHGQGYSQFEHLSHGIYSELTQFVSWTDPVKISKLVLENRTRSERQLSIAGYVELVLGTGRGANAPYVYTELDSKTGALFAANPWNAEYGKRIMFATFSTRNDSFTGDRSEFIGRNGALDRPAALIYDQPLSGKVGAGLDPCAALMTNITLGAGKRIEIAFLLGQADSREKARELVDTYRTKPLKKVLSEVVDEWGDILTRVQVETPDEAVNLMLNRWLLYQTLVCRFWARAAFYQAGGAFGFRDQLQDSMALVFTKPELTKQQILRASARQFIEGDVQHWWHPPFGRGVRTHFSDDLIWLPFVVSYYLKVTGDHSILDAEVPFLEGPLLRPDQEDSYYTPQVSRTSAAIYEHCARTLDLSLKVGVHGLPLMGAGDWNDGMNRVGHDGKGESVWLAWFLYSNLVEFAKVARERADNGRADAWLAHAAKLKESIEREAWDGAWYRRAYFDDGTPLGSAGNAECRIDSIAQTWGIISGAADPVRAQRAMDSVEQFLIRPGDNLLLLFAPAFDKTPLDPGYIKGYLPGVRENGGQYSHAAVWCSIAYAMMGNGQRAVELFGMLNPINHSSSRAGVHRYKVEPYVIAADVYSEPPYTGRGGWTWYTGSSGWMYRAGVEFILGFQLRGNRLKIDPRIHPEWNEFKLRYRYHHTLYEIHVLNPHHVAAGVASIEIDGTKLESTQKDFELIDDGINHRIVIQLG